MAKPLRPASAITLARTHWQSFLRSRQHAIGMDAWMKGRQYDLHADEPDHPLHGRPYSPKQNLTDEYDNISGLAPNAFGGLVVRTLAQTAYIKGVKLPGRNENLNAWRTWQHNRMDSRQVPLFRSAIGHGASYASVLPGVDPLTGDRMAKIDGYSAKRAAAFYDDDNDEWPAVFLTADRYTVVDKAGNKEEGWNVTLIDDNAEHNLSCVGQGMDEKDWTYISYTEHNLGVCPVARCVNSIDLDGETVGELEPVIPLLRRIDQDVFDRLIVQRFGAWAIRYIAGMAKPETTQEQAALSLAMRVDDLLMSTDPNTKFGSIPGTDPNGFIAATDADLRMLAAITQTPPHHLLGLSANLQAEALDAAEQGLRRKSSDFKMHAGEFVEQLMRLSAVIMGEQEEARAFDMQVSWVDTSAQSFQSTAQALGMVATQLGVPVEMLWERLPDWTDSDSERAKRLVEDGTFDRLVKELMAAGATPPAEPADEAPSGNPAAE